MSSKIFFVLILITSIFSYANDINQYSLGDRSPVINAGGDVNVTYNKNKNKKLIYLDSKKENIKADILSEYGGIDFTNYKIFQSLKLNEFSNGLNGRLLIIVDKKIKGIKAKIESKAYENIEYLKINYSENENIHNILAQKNLKQALLVVTNIDLEIIYLERLGRETARLDRVFLYKDKSKPTYIITRDYSIGSGSYSGPISYFFEVTNNGFNYIFKHGLVDSLKRAWVINKTPFSSEVLYKSSWVSDRILSNGDVEFDTFFTKYYYEDNIWKTKKYKKKGRWEVDRDTKFDSKEFTQDILNLEEIKSSKLLSVE